MPDYRYIGHIENDFDTKFGIPRQSNRIEALKSRILFEPEFRTPDAFRGLEEFSHLWLIWEFSESKKEHWSATVRPPRLGGNVRMGVFATRSPFRPNPIGLSSVRLDNIEFHSADGPILHVSGADLMNGTPILDIKPYLPSTDAHPDASGGFTEHLNIRPLEVFFTPEELEKIPVSGRDALLAVLAEDPRPGYQKDPARIYGIAYAGRDVRFRVEDRKILVTEVL